MRPMLFFTLLLLSTSLVQSQAIRSEPFYGVDAKQKESAKTQVHASIAKNLTVPMQLDAEGKKMYMAECAEIQESIDVLIDKKTVFDDVLWPYLKTVHAKVIASNPQLPPTRVLLVAEAVPNAFSIGEGTLVFYTGLLSELENEAQLAFVLCHEIAHFVLQHTARQLAQNIERVQSQTFKADIKRLQAAKYNQADLVESMVQKMQFRSRYHNRNLERQADSLAYLLFLKTDFDPAQSQRLMQLFKTIDEPVKDTALQLAHHFGCAQYPYKKSWAAPKSTSTWASALSAQKAENQAIADSLSTHPDAEMRLKWLDELAITLRPQMKENTANGYATIKYLSAIENVEVAYRELEYDWAIYLAVLYQKIYPECAYFKDIFALSLKALYVHAKNHTLSTVLAQPSSYHAPRYKELLSLLNNLSLSELLALQQCVQIATSTDTEYGLYSKYEYAQLLDDDAARQAAKKTYLVKYPNGRFKQKMQTGE